MKSMMYEPGKTTSLSSLPMELHFRIKREILRDPDVTFEHFKELRLVCKVFDALWSPVVLSRLLLFPPLKPTDILTHLNYLAHNPDHTAQIEALSLRNWGMSSGASPFDSPKPSRRRGRLIGSIVFLARLMILPPKLLFMFLANPKEVPHNFSNRIRAKRLTEHLPHQIQLPNVRRARLHLSSADDTKAIYRSIRMLLSLPQLSELELNVFHSPAVVYISQCLLDLCNIHKLTLRIVPEDGPISSQSLLGAFIVRNSNLSHLSILDSPFDFSGLLHGVQPLDLKHVSIDQKCRNLEALAPHLRSLQSFEYHSGRLHNGNGWCYTFRDENVFPPKIKADHLDQGLLEYIHHHPGLTSLSIVRGDHAEDASIYFSQLLTQHHETLQYLAIPNHTLAVMLNTTSGEINFLKCTGLREIVLIAANSKWFANGSCPLEFDCIGHEQQAFPVLGRLDHSLSVVIRCPDVKRYNDCLKECRTHYNPLVRNLAGRIAYEDRTYWPDRF